MGDAITKRLHIGGLNANISPDHLKDRFKSFGRVDSVQWPGPDALGQPRRFAYLLLETTAGQYKKCLNIMSGSTWRGAQLRIAEAKPTYGAKLERERNPTPEETAARLRKRKRKILNVALGQGIGKEAQDMRMVTPENYEKHKFWTMAPDNTLIRPLALRPTHPLPLLPTASASSSKRRRAPTRARRRIINPSIWNPEHLRLFNEKSDINFDPLEWTFDQEEDTQVDENGFAIIGRWITKFDGQEVSEVVKGRKRPEDIELETNFDLEDFEAASSTSDLFGTRHNNGDRPDSPLFGQRSLHGATQLVGPASEVDEGENEGSSVPRSMADASRPLSDPVASSSRPTSSALPLVPPVVDLPDVIRAQIKGEKARDLSILDSILGNTGDHPSQSRSGRLWYEDSDSDEDGRQVKVGTNTVLRLRGGAPDESDDAESDAGGSEAESAVESDESDTTSTGSDDSEASSDETSSEPTTSDDSDTPVPVAGPSKPQSTLKDMFATSQQGGSLLAHLGDIEMDESFDVSVVPLKPVQEVSTAEEEIFEPAAKAKFIPNPSDPLFFPTFQPHQHAKTRDLFSADREDPEFKRFWAQETDAEMREIWERDKLGLTREWKRRHREAKKHRRRKGGATVDDMD